MSRLMVTVLTVLVLASSHKVAVNLNEKVSFVAHVGNFGWSSAKAKNAKSVQSVDLGLNLTSVDFGLYYNF